MNKAIVLGSDAVNALGLVQSLGREGVYVIAVLDCKESVLISKSKYAKEILSPLVVLKPTAFHYSWWEGDESKSKTFKI